MESRYTIHIMPAEWRWVIVVATALALLAFAPFVWVALSGTNQWQFMGALHNYQDGATYIAKMTQGERGQWLVYFQHTPEPHNAALIQVIYPLLGHIARIASVPAIVMFHVARAGAALFMYIAIYQLAASIWMRVRTRRIFFAIASLGAGLGWLLAPLTGEIGFPDLTIPEAFPLSSTFMNVHFPLALACLALLASIIVTVFRPGAEQYPKRDGMVLIAGLLSVAVAFLYPQALAPFGAALVAYVALRWLAQKKPDERSFRWLLAVVLPAVPVAAYYIAIITNIPAFAEWNRQNVTPSPSLLVLAAGLGLPLVIALPALLRAVRGFEQDDDRFMLLWLAAIVVFMYLPTNLQRRFSAGMMMPIAYFATRAIEEFWFRYVSRRYRAYVFAVFIPVIVVSQIFILFLPVLPAVSGSPARAVGIFLERQYTVAYRWLDLRATAGEVVLASPVVSAWLPGWAGTRVVYGHPYETLDAAAKRAAVEAWYALSGSDTDACAALLDEYNVQYVIIGPEERKLGAVGCEADLRRLFTSGQVSVYAP